MGQPNELGQVRPGYLADLLLVDGDPLADITILQDRDRLAAIMKNGTFYKEPTFTSSSHRAGPPSDPDAAVDSDFRLDP
jgi:hypothetical protein